MKLEHIAHHLKEQAYNNEHQKKTFVDLKFKIIPFNKNVVFI